jgi:hypothetical protein
MDEVVVLSIAHVNPLQENKMELITCDANVRLRVSGGTPRKRAASAKSVWKSRPPPGNRAGVYFCARFHRLVFRRSGESPGHSGRDAGRPETGVPHGACGQTACLCFRFGKEAGDRTKAWMNRLTQDGITAWSVANLESAPALVRGMIRSSMRKATPEPLLARSLIMTKDAKAWKFALGAKQDNLPVVVVFDSTTQIQWKFEGLFGDEPYRELKTRLEGAVAK